MKKVVSLVLALVLAMCMFAVAEEATVMSFEEYSAAELDTPVTVGAYVQMVAYNAQYGNVCLYLADEDGAYYVYRAACDDALAESLWIGAPVVVSGFKSAWAGEVEIIEASITVLDVEEGVTFDAIDVTDILANEELIDCMNALVAVNGAEVVAYNENGDAFSYAWDGSGAAGANSDLYFTVKVGEANYTMTVESDECAEGTDVYTAVTGLKVGDVIDLTGFLYWYNGANIHVTSVVVK